jgi:hypothetical protein
MSYHIFQQIAGGIDELVMRQRANKKGLKESFVSICFFPNSFNP